MKGHVKAHVSTHTHEDIWGHVYMSAYESHESTHVRALAAPPMKSALQGACASRSTKYTQNLRIKIHIAQPCLARQFASSCQIAAFT